MNDSRPAPLVCLTVSALLAFPGVIPAAGGPELVLNLWPDRPPGETKALPPEADQTRDTDKLIAGRRIIKLGNVSTPQIAVHRPAPGNDTGAAVLVAPGGGHNILAYDLEGTEAAEWLTSLGVTGVVLKYRVPTRTPDTRRWLAAVQDAQRAISLVRSRAVEWKLDPRRIGILGFSAGGETAGLAALLFDERQYPPVDEVDRVSSRPDFALLIYPGGLADPKTGMLREHVKVPAGCPPMFFAHAWDDRVTVLSSLLLGAELKRAGVPVGMHLYPTGGHGYGLRRTEEPVTTWPDRAAEWLRAGGWLKKS
jgi:acetyl esterase/lipase